MRQPDNDIVVVDVAEGGVVFALPPGLLQNQIPAVHSGHQILVLSETARKRRNLGCTNTEEPASPEEHGCFKSSGHGVNHVCVLTALLGWNLGDGEIKHTHVAQDNAAIKEADVQTCKCCTLNALVYLLEGACGLNYSQTKDSVKVFF